MSNGPSPAPLLSQDTYLADRRALPREEFLARHPEPVLVITLAPEAPSMEGEGAFRTQFITHSHEADALGLGAGRTFIVPIVKRMQDAFQSFIWVGRESRCDVSLPFTNVSKLQAQFIVRPGGALELLDAGSTNGTFVDGVQLEKNKPVPLRDGAAVSFGKIDARFHTAEGLWEALGQRR